MEIKNLKVNNISTIAFLTEEERKLYNDLCENYNKLSSIKKYCYQVILNNKFNLTYNEHVERLRQNKFYKRECTTLTKKKLDNEQKVYYKELKKEHNWKSILSEADDIEKELNKIIRSSKLKDTRSLNIEISDYYSVYVSNSTLTRNVDNNDIFIVTLNNKYIKTTRIWEQIVKNGFTYRKDGKIVKVEFYTSSSGQIRKEKGFFVVKDNLNRVINTLNCGLTLEDINKLGGCNINKYLAYSALNTSSTDIWDRFDIDKAIVVEDFETEIETEVDYIDNSTFKITRKRMNVPIPHTDGCGMMLPSVSRKNMMCRLPWIKGLLTVSNFHKFNKKYGVSDTITDIYGREHNINDIEVIFSKSQFKMWKYYPNEYNKDGSTKEYGWDKYKRNFKQYDCTANICKVEQKKKDFKQATLNYQMMQTLTDITDVEIRNLVNNDIEYINNVYIDKKLQIKELTKGNNALSKILKVYPNFLNDAHVQKMLSNKLTKKRKELLNGDISVKDAKYTFIVPDIIAWMQFLFCNDKNPEGVLKENEVHCSLFDYDEVDVLRSPHLYKEHNIRQNIEIPEEYREFFKIGNSRQLGIYTSVRDSISKILQFDVDGDEALVVQDKYFVDIAKRNVKNVVPLFYEMGKAKPEKLSNVAFHRGLKNAFRYNQVGKYSNYLTAEWNTTQDLETLKVLCSLNNYSIDASKCLFMRYPQKDTDIYNKIEEAKEKKMPYFFKYVKDYYANKELTTEKSTMNKLVWYLEEEFEKVNGKRYNIKADKFNYKQFLNNKSILSKKNNLTDEKERIYNLAYKDYRNYNGEIEESIYKAQNDEKKFIRNVYTDYRNKLKEYAQENNIDWIEYVDAIIATFYKNNKNSINKTILLEMFSTEILSNLRKNIKQKVR